MLKYMCFFVMTSIISSMNITLALSKSASKNFSGTKVSGKCPGRVVPKISSSSKKNYHVVCKGIDLSNPHSFKRNRKIAAGQIFSNIIALSENKKQARKEVLKFIENDLDFNKLAAQGGRIKVKIGDEAFDVEVDYNQFSDQKPIDKDEYKDIAKNLENITKNLSNDLIGRGDFLEKNIYFKPNYETIWGTNKEQILNNLNATKYKVPNQVFENFKNNPNNQEWIKKLPENEIENILTKDMIMQFQK